MNLAGLPLPEFNDPVAEELFNMEPCTSRQAEERDNNRAAKKKTAAKPKKPKAPEAAVDEPFACSFEGCDKVR